MRPDYNAACTSAAINQGLGPASLALAQAGIPFTLDQTGGFTMCINVTPTTDPEFRHIWITDASFDEEPPVQGTCLVGLYDQLDGSEGQDPQACTTVPIEELAEMVRVYGGGTFKRDTSLATLTRALDICHDQLKDAVHHWTDTTWEDFAKAKTAELGALIKLLAKEMEVLNAEPDRTNCDPPY